MQKTHFARGYIPVIGAEVTALPADEMQRTRKCVRCGRAYKESDNIGSWRCVEHVGGYDPVRRLYDCCDNNNAGCVVCDHAESLQTPYPGSTTDRQITGGVPAFKLRVGNLKELAGVHQEALQKPPDFEQDVREQGRVDLAWVYLYRRCLIGVPEKATGVTLHR